MEKTRSTHFSVPKKALSFFLAFLMVLTAGAVGIVPLKDITPIAEAITSQTAGNYVIRFQINVRNKADKQGKNPSACKTYNVQITVLHTRLCR